MDARLQQLLEALQAKKQQQPIQPMQGVGTMAHAGSVAPLMPAPMAPQRPAPLQVVADAVTPQTQGMPLPDGGDTNYYPNGIRRQAMDERGPDGEPLVPNGPSDAVPMNPFYNAQYDKRNGLNAPLDRQQWQQQQQQLPAPPAGTEGLPYAQNEMNRALGDLTQIGQASQAGKRYQDLSKLGIPTDEDRPVEGRPAQMPVTVTTRPPEDVAIPPKPPSEQEWLETELERIRQAPPEKQNKWMEALIIGLQATQRIADPTNQAGSYQQGAPIRSLAEMKKAEAIQKVEGRLKPIYEKNKREQDKIMGGLTVREKIADVTRKENEAKTAGQPKVKTEKIGDRVYTSTDDGLTWKDAQGIRAPQEIEVEIAGKKGTIPFEKAYETQEARIRAEITVDAQRLRDQLATAEKTTEYNAERTDDDNKAIQAWSDEVTKLKVEGQANLDAGARAWEQAQIHRNAGRLAEAIAKEEESDKLKAEGNRQMTLGNQKQQRPPKPSTRVSAPAQGRGRTSKANDPLEFFK